MKYIYGFNVNLFHQVVNSAFPKKKRSRSSSSFVCCYINGIILRRKLFFGGSCFISSLNKASSTILLTLFAKFKPALCVKNAPDIAPASSPGGNPIPDTSKAVTINLMPTNATPNAMNAPLDARIALENNSSNSTKISIFTALLKRTYKTIRFNVVAIPSVGKAPAIPPAILCCVTIDFNLFFIVSL